MKAFQKWSTPSCVSQCTRNEIDSLNVKSEFSVERDERDPLELEPDDHDAVVLAGPRHVRDAGVALRVAGATAEDLDVVLGGLLGLAVEPEYGLIFCIGGSPL